MSDLQPPVPVEKRKTDRTLLQVVENHSAWILLRTGKVSTRVIDFSPFGVGVILDGNENRVQLVLGDKTNLELQRDGQRIEVEATLVTISKTNHLRKPYTRLGFRIITQDETRGRALVRRDRRLVLKDVRDVACHCDDTSRPGTKASFTIRDISRGGILLETSTRNKFLLPGLRLSCWFEIPGKDGFAAEMRILHIHNVHSTYRLGCVFEPLSPTAVAELGDLCLNFGLDVNVQAIVEAGFPVGPFSPVPPPQGSANFQDFMQVPQLRLEMDHGRGQNLEVRDPWQMIDGLDEEAQQIFVKLGTQVVASARLLMSRSDRRNLGLDAGIKVPETVWKDGFAAVSHIVIEAEFNVSDSYVLSRLWSYIFQAAFRSQRPWLIVEHSESAADSFRKLRFWPREPIKVERAVEQSAGVNREPEKYSWLDLNAVFEGRNLPFKHWSLMIAPLCRVIAQERKLTITKFLALKLVLAFPLRQLMIWRFRCDEDWRLQECIERASPSTPG